ncbi:MAG: 3'-5' exonuclease [Terracidiphilus sp.]
MDFVVIDVETANGRMESICQVGIASFRKGRLAATWESRVDPEDDFSPFNISIHGIDASQVRGAPTWAQVFPQVAARLRGRITVSHTSFDRLALARACRRYALPECACRWLDSARVVRHTWPRFSRSGYSLPNLAAHFGIEYRAHDALEDARCAGWVLLRAVAETGLSPEQWLARMEPPAGLAGRGCPKTKPSPP